MNKTVKSYLDFVNEGRTEQKKIDELLEIMKKRKLTKEEQDLLVHLSKGGSLPEEEHDRPTLQTHKTGGGYLFDDEGNVMTHEEEPTNPGQEFVTTKGKQRSADKIHDVIDARVYRNKDSEERLIFSHATYETDSGITNDWIIYRTIGTDKHIYGQFMDTNLPRFQYYKTTPPDILWKELDYKYDYGMILDEDLYEDFTNFVTLYKENQRRNAHVLDRLHNRFKKIL